MPASVPGQMPYAASPFASDYDAQMNAALRQKRLAEMLQQQALAPSAMPNVPGAKMSWLEPLSKALQGGLSGYMGDKADTAEKAAATARQAGMENWMNSEPQGTAATEGTPGTPDIPAQPAANAMFGQTPDQDLSPSTAALAPPPDTGAAPPMLPKGVAAAFGAGGMPGSPLATGAPGAPGASPDLGPSADAATQALTPTPPMLPQPPDVGSPIATPQRGATNMIPGTPGVAPTPFLPPSPAAIRAHAAQGFQFGPVAAKFAEKEMERTLPQTGKDRYISTPDGVLDMGAAQDSTPQWLGQSPQAKAKFDAQEADKKAALAQAETDKIRSDATIRAVAAGHDNARIVVHTGEGGGGTSTLAGGLTNINGDVLAYNGKTNKYTIAGTGKEFVPTAGDPVITKGEEKGILDATTNLRSAKQARDLSAAIRQDAIDHPGSGAFSPGNNVRALVNAKSGGFLFDPSSKLSPEQQVMRSNVNRDIAQEMHQLYGSAFTSSEQKTASDIMKMPGNSAEQVARKLDAQAEFREQMSRDHGGKAHGIAMARISESGRAPAAAGGTGDDALLNKYGPKS